VHSRIEEGETEGSTRRREVIRNIYGEGEREEGACATTESRALFSLIQRLSIRGRRGSRCCSRPHRRCTATCPRPVPFYLAPATPHQPSCCWCFDVCRSLSRLPAVLVLQNSFFFSYHKIQSLLLLFFVLQTFGYNCVTDSLSRVLVPVPVPVRCSSEIFRHI
jgi:hypothetical protein